MLRAGRIRFACWQVVLRGLLRVQPGRRSGRGFPPLLCTSRGLDRVPTWRRVLLLAAAVTRTATSPRAPVTFDAAYPATASVPAESAPRLPGLDYHRAPRLRPGTLQLVGHEYLLAGFLTERQRLHEPPNRPHAVPPQHRRRVQASAHVRRRYTRERNHIKSAVPLRDVDADRLDQRERRRQCYLLRRGLRPVDKCVAGQPCGSRALHVCRPRQVCQEQGRHGRRNTIK